MPIVLIDFAFAWQRSCTCHLEPDESDWNDLWNTLVEAGIDYDLTKEYYVARDEYEY